MIGAFLRLLGNISIQLALLFGLIWAAIHLLRIRSPSVRYHLWLLVILAPLLLTPLNLAMPGLSIVGRDADEASTDTPVGIDHAALSSGAESPAVMQADEASGGRAAAHEGPSSSFPFGLTHLLCLIWGVGFLVSTASIIAGWLRLRRLISRSRRADEGLYELLSSLSGEMGLRRRVELLISDELAIPVVFGWLRPFILLPPSMSGGEARMALIHELAHLKRGDYQINLLYRFLRAALFFHPLYRIAGERMREACEQICDGWVVKLTGERANYARLLIDLLAAQTGLSGKLSPAMAEGSRLGRRVEMVLDAERDLSTGLTLGAGVCIFLIGGAAIAGISAVRLSDVSLGEVSPAPRAAIPPEKGVTVTGTVYWEDGKTPFEGAFVYWKRYRVDLPTPGGGFDRSDPVRTDKGGRYEIVVPPSCEGWVPNRLYIAYPGMETVGIDIDPKLREGSVLRRDFILRPAASISGKVIGVEDHPRRLFIEVLLPSGGSLGRGYCYTDPDGSYRFVLTSRHFETYDIDVPHPHQISGFYWEVLGDAEEVRCKIVARVEGFEPVEVGEFVIVRGRETGGVDIKPLRPTGKVSGIVIGPDGRPAGGVRLVMISDPYYPYRIPIETISRPDGTFTFEDVPEGRYVDFVVEDPRLKCGKPFGLRFVSVKSGETVGGIKLKLRLATRIKGRIFKADGKTPLSYAKLEMRCQTRDAGGFGTTILTDGDGRYEFTVRGTVYMVTMIKGDVEVSKEVEVKAGEVFEGLNFVMGKVTERKLTPRERWALRIAERLVRRLSRGLAKGDISEVEGCFTERFLEERRTRMRRAIGEGSVSRVELIDIFAIKEDEFKVRLKWAPVPKRIGLALLKVVRENEEWKFDFWFR